MSKDKISHRELLTFSNLTNLEWEFVDLEVVKKNESDAPVKKEDESADDISTQLNDLLSTPESFVRYNTETDSYSYPYLEGKSGKNIKLSDEEKEKGLAQMRSKVGIAMEYLEKEKQGNSEGEFLSALKNNFFYSSSLRHTNKNFKGRCETLSR